MIGQIPYSGLLLLELRKSYLYGPLARQSLPLTIG